MYNIAASAFMPTTGGLAQVRVFFPSSSIELDEYLLYPVLFYFVQVFGRKPALLFSLALFSLGCILCGAAQNQDMLIAGRGSLVPFRIFSSCLDVESLRVSHPRRRWRRPILRVDYRALGYGATAGERDLQWYLASVSSTESFSFS